MRAADHADRLRRCGATHAADRALGCALEFERRAAEELCDRYDQEPTRGILYRSAAQMALDLSRWREAESLGCAGLVGDPPADVLAELRAVVERAQAKLAPAGQGEYYFCAALTAQNIGGTVGT